MKKMLNLVKIDYIRYICFFIMGIVFSILISKIFRSVNNVNINDLDASNEPKKVEVIIPLIVENNILNSDTPEKFITTMQIELIKALKDNNFNKFYKLFTENFALEDAAKIALGRVWYTMNDDIRHEFLELFSFYIANSYYTSVGEIIRHADDIVIQNISALIEGSSIYSGRMVIVRNTEGNINVGFTLKQEKNNKFKLVDFTAFRVSFNMFIRRLFKPMLSHGIEYIILNLKKENESRHK